MKGVAIWQGNKRNLTVNTMKGLLIILVVVGHSNWEYREIIYWFHMPAFFMVSGYLLKITNNGIKKQWILRECKSLLLPYLAYAFLLGLVKIPFGVEAVLVQWASCVYGGEVAGGVYWFITVLLLSEITIMIMENRVQSRSTKNLVYLVMYLAGVAESLIFIPSTTINVPTYTKLPWNVDVCLVAIPYMMVGKTIQNNQEKIIGFLKSKVGILLIFCSALSLSGFLYFSHAFNWFTLDMKYSQYKNILLDMICPIVFCSFIWLVSKLLSEKAGDIHWIYQEKKPTIMYLHIFVRDYLMISVFGKQYSVILYLEITSSVCMVWDYTLSRLPRIAPLFGVKPCIR